MEENRVPQATLAYRVTAWVVAVFVGSVAGIGLGLLTQDFWTGLVAGVAAIGLIGFSITLAARREGHGTIDAAPPWTGDAGARHDGGSL
ncbi:hypothetical protein [Microbacterium sp. NPDC055665]